MAAFNNYEVELLTTQFSSTLELLLQQKDTRLRGAVRSGSHVGKQASPVQYVGALQFKQAAGRGSPLQPQTAQYQRRWVFPNDKDLAVQVDTFDELRTIVDPRSALNADLQAAANRLYDDIIISAFFGSATTGVDASSQTTETFNSGADFPISVAISSSFGAGASTGLTVKKLIEAKRILRRYENEMNTGNLHICIGAQQEADLLNQIEVVSAEYNKPMMGTDGMIESFLGFKFHHSERLTTDGTANRYVPVWLEDGMYLGLWKDYTCRVTERNDLTGHPWQAYAMVSLGATRLQGGKVLQLSCLDSSVGTSSSGDITV
jgi:Phage capsid protein